MSDLAPKRASLLSIGHSNHPLEEFLELLRQHEIEVLVDVRSQPIVKDYDISIWYSVKHNLEVSRVAIYARRERELTC